MKKYFLLLFLAIPLSAMENDNVANENLSTHELEWHHDPNTGLRLAIQKNDIEKLKAYLSLGADVNHRSRLIIGTKPNWIMKKIFKMKDTRKTRDSCPPLLSAVAQPNNSPNPAIIETLCAHGADTKEHALVGVECNDANEGPTPLHYLISSNLETFYEGSHDILKCIDILLHYGAPLDGRTNYHEKNLEYFSNGYESLKTLFSETTSEPLIVGTPLDYAVGFGCLDVVKRLLVPTALALYNPTRDKEQLLESKKRVKTWLLTSNRLLHKGIDKKVLQYLPEDTYSAEMLAALIKQCSGSAEIDDFVNTLPHEWFEQLLKDKDFAPVTKQGIVTTIQQCLHSKISALIEEKKYLDYIEERKTDPGETLYSDPLNKGVVPSLTEFFEIEDSLGVREDYIKEYYDRMHQQEVKE